jgi:hypothetical protein
LKRILFLQYLGLNSGSRVSYSGALPFMSHLSHLQLFFALVIFHIVAHIYDQVSLYCYLPIYISHIAGTTGTHHHTQLLD